MITKVLSEHITVTTANTVNSANLVRIHLPAGGSDNANVSIHDANTDIIGSFIMSPGDTELIDKRFTDTITSNTAVSCTSVTIRG